LKENAVAKSKLERKRKSDKYNALIIWKVEKGIYHIEELTLKLAIQVKSNIKGP
jgi:hypothetical protein